MLLTKLHIPAQSKHLVHRPNLYNKLNQGLNHKLILISAPPGFGKSTIISSWIQQNKIPTAWFSIDNNDNDPVDFVSYIIYAIQNIEINFGQKALELLNSPSPPKIISILNILINELLTIKEDFVLALDDFHFIQGIEIPELLAYLLEHIPDNIHVLISTRSEPNLPLSRYRSRHEMTELRANDLSFSANDITHLFNKKFKFKLSTSDIQLLETKTEGWIAGLQLAALSMQENKDKSAFIETFAGNNRYIIDYLIEEVLRIQSEESKEFLLSTSVLKRLSAPLCNFVLDRSDSQAMLEKLENNNMFVFPLDDERYWYRYHHLFGDLLKQRFLNKNHSKSIDIQNKAIQWFEENNMPELAISLAFDTNNLEKGIQLLNLQAQILWEHGHHKAILGYGDKLPEETLKHNPEFSLYYAWVLTTTGNIAKAEKLLSQIQQHIDRSTTQQFPEPLLGKIAIAQAFSISQGQQVTDIFELCEFGIAKTPHDDNFWLAWAWFSYALGHFANGELQQASEAFTKAIGYAEKGENIFQISTIITRLSENLQLLGHYTKAYNLCKNLLAKMSDNGLIEIAESDWAYAALYQTLGVTQFLWVDLDNALDNIKKAYTLSHDGNDIFQRSFILMIYSYILKIQDNPDAEQMSNELESIIAQPQIPPFLKAYHLGWKLFWLIRDEDFDTAESIFKAHNIDMDTTITHTNEPLCLSYARYLILKSLYKDAELILNQMYPMACASKKVERMIEIKVMYAALYNHLNEIDIAVTHLMDAMEIASSENLCSYFVYNIDKIDNLFPMIYKKCATSVTNIPKVFITNLKLAIEKSKELHSQTHETFDISTRELDTLKLVVQGLSNQQIADKLFISLNTVKTHMRRILEKLDVDNRQQAATKAKELGLD